MRHARMSARTRHVVFAACLLASCALAADRQDQGAEAFALPATDENVPGAGPLRRAEWFRNLWKTRRAAWAARREQDRGALVFLGDSITQEWGGGLGAAFPG